MEIPDRVRSQYSCQLCGDSPHRRSTPNVKLVIDHDHNVFPKRARGKLCHGCNIGLGWIEKFIDRNCLENVIEYARTHGFEKCPEAQYFGFSEVQ
jgi:hypothetical protein